MWIIVYIKKMRSRSFTLRKMLLSPYEKFEVVGVFKSFWKAWRIKKWAVAKTTCLWSRKSEGARETTSQAGICPILKHEEDAKIRLKGLIWRIVMKDRSLANYAGIWKRLSILARWNVDCNLLIIRQNLNPTMTAAEYRIHTIQFQTDIDRLRLIWL